MSGAILKRAAYGLNLINCASPKCEYGYVILNICKGNHATCISVALFLQPSRISCLICAMIRVCQTFLSKAD